MQPDYTSSRATGQAARPIRPGSQPNFSPKTGCVFVAIDVNRTISNTSAFQSSVDPRPCIQVRSCDLDVDPMNSTLELDPDVPNTKK